MPVMEFGGHLASTTLNKFKPIVGTTSYVSILGTQKVAAHEIYWIPKDIDTDTFGPIITDSPLARKAFGNPSQTYALPVYVHNAMNDPNGNIMVWKLTTTLYNQLLELSKQGDLNRYTICVTARKQGQGTRTEMSLLPSPILRDYWPADFKAKIDETVNFWFEFCDSTLYQTLTEPELISLLQNAGFDFQSNSFPNRIAQGSYFAKQAVGSVFNQGNQPQIQMQQPAPNPVMIGSSQPIGISATPVAPNPTVVPVQNAEPMGQPNVVPVQVAQPVVNVQTIPVVSPVGNPNMVPVENTVPAPNPGIINTVNPQVTPQLNQATNQPPVNTVPVQETPVSTMSQEDVNALFDDENL